MIIQSYYYYLPIVVQETCHLKGIGILFQARQCSQLYSSIALSESFPFLVISLAHYYLKLGVKAGDMRSFLY